MEEGKGATATLKIAEADHTWMEKEKERLRDVEGTKPTQAELFRRMAESYAKHVKSAPRPAVSKDDPFAGLDAKDMDYVKRFAAVLRSRNKTAVEAVTRNVDAFLLLVELTEQAHKGR